MDGVRSLAVLGFAALVFGGCGDEEEPTPPDRYPDGMVPPCEVEAGVGQSDGQAQVLSQTVREVQLPAVRAGAPWRYQATVGGTSASSLRSGELPAGLSLESGRVVGTVSAGAVESPTLYTFELDGDGDEVVQARLTVLPDEAVEPSTLPRYWEAGPYPTWNTHPLPECSANPAIPDLFGGPVALYVTYPAASVSTDTGDGSVAAGRWPVVVFAHANNDRVCNIFERYYSLHDHWASWGYIVVAVDGTGLNCQGGSVQNIQDRTAGQEAALEVLAQLDADPTSRFYGRVDLGRVVYAGHSRGGGASKWGAIINDRVRAVMDIQGVNYGFGTGLLPPVPVLGITAGEDVDLNYPAVDPTEDHLTGPYTWVNIYGGIHAYTADTAPIEPDDVPLISQEQQHDITEYYTTAFLARFVGVGDGSAPMVFSPALEAEGVLFSHQGAEVMDAEVSPLGVGVRWNRQGGLLIDDFSGAGDRGRNLTGGRNLSTGLEASDEVPTYQPSQPGVTGAFSWAWSRRLVAGAEGGTFELEMGDGDGVEVGPGAVLLARVKGPDSGAVAAFDVVFETADGEGRVDGHAHLGPEALENRFSQLVVPLDAVGLPGTSRLLRSVTFEIEGGTLFLDDVRIE